ncbi:nuclear transcription factor Y subunit gamma-like [Anopheles nili]|uniref:nuclear transcription factor Y subunit gamma-like n=1 Tax=Anopheles nili TaxID=185578 RepID=UPI00237C04A7|nr:nuclear transcription factor Y subunit gamma-like [Anopheles nili]
MPKKILANVSTPVTVDSVLVTITSTTTTTTTANTTAVTTSPSTTVITATAVEDPCAKLKSIETLRNIQRFWPNVMRDIRLVENIETGNQPLPLARIKKIMKLDENVRMIASDAPLLFAKAIEIFIQELTLRAWLHTEHNKRRTLQRSDIAMAITQYDQFDFLIDIVPRNDLKLYKAEVDDKSPEGAGSGSTPNVTDDVQYFLQLAQQHQLTLPHPPKAITNGGTTVLDLATVIGAASIGSTPVTVTLPCKQQKPGSTGDSTGTTQGNVLQQQMGGVQISGNSKKISLTLATQAALQTASGQSIILSNGSTSAGAITNGATTGIPSASAGQLVSTGQPLQLLQHIVTPTGEITQIPLNFIRTTGSTGTANASQPILIQAAPMQTGPTIIHTTPTSVFLSANQLQQLQQSQQQHQQQSHQQKQSHHQQQQLQNNPQQQRH